MTGSILACGACLRRAMQILPRQKAAFEATFVLQSRQLPLQSQRDHTTAAAFTAAIEDTPPTSSLSDAGHGSVSAKRSLEQMKRNVRKHLNYLDDPWKIAQDVEGMLAKDRFDEAVLLTQAAGKSMQVTVSWNHLIDYMMEKQQLRKAIKLYNDMKKRGQLPNVQTYTVLFRGCAKSQHPKLAVSEAIKHYHILLKDKRLEPNSIHLNAVLNVCGRAGDLDSMFSIVDTANDSTRAPTSYTYTTILNALRFQVLKDVDDLSPEEKAAHLLKMISRAKALWEEVIDKWRQGRMAIDEELVCAMGRVILLAPERAEKSEVFDLLEQTMNIPNMTKQEVISAQDYDTKGNIESAQKNKLNAQKKQKKKLLHVKPGCNTLSLVLTTLASAKQSTFGIKYWNYFIREHRVQPDNDNWMRMFGMLKTAKASAHASVLINSVPDSFVNPRYYRIAMETCVRDNINHNAIKHSNRILTSMMERLRVPDCHAMRLYLRVALVSHYEFRTRSREGDAASAKRDYGMQIAEALARLWDPYLKTHEYYFEKSKASAKHNKGILYNDQREVIALARNMYGAFSKVIEERMLPEEDLRQIRPVGTRINRTITSFYSNRAEKEPKLKQRDGAADTDGESPPKDTHDDVMDSSEFEYRPAGDFIWNTTKAADDMTVGTQHRRRPNYNSSSSDFQPTSRRWTQDTSRS